jgi:hypothetical protein
MYPREMGVQTGTNGFISTSKTFTAAIYREHGHQRTSEKAGASAVVD